MANYWYVDINSNNLTAEAAGEILKYTGENHLIRSFSYHHGDCVNGKLSGELHMNTRGLPNIVDILEKYGITEDEMEWEDEFDVAWTAIFEQYFTNLPITKEYHSILEKNVDEEVIKLYWDGANRNELEDYFNTCWGSRSFRFEPENGVIVGIKNEFEAETEVESEKKIRVDYQSKFYGW